MPLLSTSVDHVILALVMTPHVGTARLEPSRHLFLNMTHDRIGDGFFHRAFQDALGLLQKLLRERLFVALSSRPATHTARLHVASITDSIMPFVMTRFQWASSQIFRFRFAFARMNSTFTLRAFSTAMA